MKIKNKILTCLSAFLGVFLMLFSYFSVSSFNVNTNISSAYVPTESGNRYYASKSKISYDTPYIPISYFYTQSVTNNYFTLSFDNSYNNNNYISYLDTYFLKSLENVETSVYLILPYFSLSSNLDDFVYDILDYNGNSVYHFTDFNIPTDSFGGGTNNYFKTNLFITPSTINFNVYINLNYIIDNVEIIDSLSDLILNYKFYFLGENSSALSYSNAFLLFANYSNFYISEIYVHPGAITSVFFPFSNIRKDFFFNNYLLDLSFIENNQALYDFYYDKGYNLGYQTGLIDGSNQDDIIRSAIFSFASYPFTILGGFLNFTLFGINLYSLLLSLISVFLVIWVIKKIM